jgi:hypothetical protein
MNALRWMMVAMMALLLAGPAVLASQAQPPPAVEGFVPANDLPATEQLPAAPFIIGAYSCFLVLMVGYAWSIGRRLNAVEKEMRALEHRRLQEGSTR